MNPSSSSASGLPPSSLATTVMSGHLNNLEELALMSAPLLDITSLELMVESLPVLQLVGRLQGWNITPSQIEVFRKKIKQENYDLRLWYNLPMHLELDFDEDLVCFGFEDTLDLGTSEKYHEKMF